jgi:aminoglycoside 3-N-acetyltransferase
MSIEEIIARTGDKPITVKRLVIDLRALGIKPGMTLLVHSSLSQIGCVCGGAMSVVLALQEVLGEDGTLMMPTMSSDWSDPAQWRAPPVPESWWPVIREHWPAWDADLTPSMKMGAIADTFRQQREVIRSHHPDCSFAARGPSARFLTDNHELKQSVGEASPVGRLNELNGHILLLGVGHANNSSIHLAEYRATYKGKHIHTQGAALLVNGERRWVEYETLKLNEDDFDQVGKAFEQHTNHTTIGQVGLAESRLMCQRPLVDFAAQWMSANR